MAVVVADDVHDHAGPAVGAAAAGRGAAREQGAERRDGRHQPESRQRPSYVDWTVSTQGQLTLIDFGGARP